MLPKLYMYWCLLVLVTMTQYAWGLDATPSYFEQNVQPGATYSIFSPNYPGQYARGFQYRWVANCFIGYNCRLDCTNVTIPHSNSCSMDRLLISLSGDLTLTNADTYCDTGTITNLVSTGQRIVVGLITSLNSPGGMFLCALRAQVYKKTIKKRLVDGNDTQVHEFPMMVLFFNISEDEVQGGGVIIHQNYIMTAAHLIYQRDLTDYRIRVGVHKISQVASTEQIISMEETIIHPNYNPDTVDYDIALVKTTVEIQFNDIVGPVCLPFKFKHKDLTGKNVLALGWGFTNSSEDAVSKDILQKVELNVTTQEFCKEAYKSYNPITDRMLCTYTEGKDACEADSGGPILYTDPDTGLLFSVGIISYGVECALSGYPGVNTRVTEMLSWVTNNTKIAQYCVI